jgi:hypothetical protein
MRMTRARSKIEGLTCTAIKVDLFNGMQIEVAAMLLRDAEKHDGVNAGRYNKDRDWSLNVIEKLNALIVAVEADLIVELFEVEDTRLDEIDNTPEEQEAKKDAKDSLSYPTFGGGGETPQR